MRRLAFRSAAPTLAKTVSRSIESSASIFATTVPSGRGEAQHLGAPINRVLSTGF